MPRSPVGCRTGPRIGRSRLGSTFGSSGVPLADVPMNMHEGLSGLTQKAPLLMAPRQVINDDAPAPVARAAQHAPLSACAPPGLGGDLVDRHGDLPDPGGGPADLAGDPVDPWRDHGHPAGPLSG